MSAPAIPATNKDDKVQGNTDLISVLLIDDHSLIVELVRSFLGEDGGFAITVAGDLNSGIGKIREVGGFNVVLLDVVLPGLTGISDVAKVVENNADGAVVLFSGSVSASFVEKAVQVGARGYIPKTLPLKALTSVIRLVAAGQTFVPSGIAYRPDGSQVGDLRLSQVETTVLHHIGEGLSNKEIAFRLEMSESTVKMHIRTICRKLGAKNRTHAVIIGRADGLL